MRWFARADGNYTSGKHRTHYVGYPKGDGTDEYPHKIRATKSGRIVLDEWNTLISLDEALYTVQEGQWIEVSPDWLVPEVLVIFGKVGE